MSRCPGTVETRRTRPKPCPHEGHLRSMLIDGVTRDINSSDLRVLGALMRIKVKRELLVLGIRIPRLVRSGAPLVGGLVAFVRATGHELLDFREDFRQFPLDFLRLSAELGRPFQQRADLCRYV